MFFKSLRFWIKVFSFLIVFLFFYFINFEENNNKNNYFSDYKNYLDKANNILPENFINKKIRQLSWHKDIKIQFKEKNNNLKISVKRIKTEKLSYEELKKIVGRILNFHSSSLKYSWKLYFKICNFNKIVCRKVKFENISYQKKIQYLAIIQFVIASLDKNLLYHKNNFKKTIKMIFIDWNNMRRWYASHHIVYLNVGNVKNNKEFFNVLIHELWHIFDLWVLNWSSKLKSRLYTEFSDSVFSVDDPSIEFYKISWISEKIRRWWQSVRDFVSGYGMTDPFEDFAETFNVYMNHYLYFKYLAYNNYILQLKFDFIDRYFNGFHFFDDKNSLKKVKLNPSRRPWDSTIMK